MYHWYVKGAFPAVPVTVSCVGLYPEHSVIFPEVCDPELNGTETDIVNVQDSPATV